MTAPTEEHAPVPERAASARHFAPVEPAPPPAGPTRRWMAVFCSVLVLVVAAAGALTWVGVRTVRDSRAGRNVSSVTDPALPGFEAFLEPTPTLLVLHVSDGILRSAAVMALSSGDQGGSVLVIPPDTFVSRDPNSVSLAYVVAFSPDPTDPANVRQAAQDLLGFGIGEVAVVDDARWARLLAPVSPLTIANPDAVPGFPAGELQLTADQVAPYLEARNEGDSELSRMYRQQLFYEAWAAAVAASTDPAVVPGEVESGLGRFVRGLAGGPRQVVTLPVEELPTGETVRIQPVVAAIRDTVTEVVPFPTASRPGTRVRVRVLDGTGDQDHVLRASPLIVPADAEIVVVGNADRFDYDETEIRYHVPSARAAADALQASLGAGKVVDDPRQTDTFDVTIVLGTDV